MNSTFEAATCLVASVDISQYFESLINLSHTVAWNTGTCWNRVHCIFNFCFAFLHCFKTSYFTNFDYSLLSQRSTILINRSKASQLSPAVKVIFLANFMASCSVLAPKASLPGRADCARERAYKCRARYPRGVSCMPSIAIDFSRNSLLKVNKSSRVACCTEIFDLHALRNSSLVEPHTSCNVVVHAAKLYIPSVAKLLDGFIGEHQMLISEREIPRTDSERAESEMNTIQRFSSLLFNVLIGPGYIQRLPIQASHLAGLLKGSS